MYSYIQETCVGDVSGAMLAAEGGAVKNTQPGKLWSSASFLQQGFMTLRNAAFSVQSALYGWNEFHRMNRIAYTLDKEGLIKAKKRCAGVSESHSYG